MMLIVGLILGTLILVALEVFLPGGVLGVAAVVTLLVASYLTYVDYGLFQALMVFFGTVFASLALAIAQFSFLAKTSYGQKLFLRKSVEGRTNSDKGHDAIVGKSGQTLTRLNPTGMVLINGKNYEAFSRDGYIGKNESVRVIARDNFKLIIQKS
ncbi:MAG: NfeD family protein [Coraliomargarita sp.]